MYWLAPSAGLSAATAQTRAPAGDTSAIQIDSLTHLPSRYLKTTRTVRVFLPEDYRRTRLRYPVLYANDGQDMEALGLVRTLDSLIHRGDIPPVIVVAVHASDRRLQEYGTSGEPNAQGLGADAEGYERFLAEELVPLINRGYRVHRAPEHTALMGWSLGALSAFDVAWRHSDVFGMVGAFSGSFWWRTDDSTVGDRQASRIMHRRIRETRSVPALRAWFEAGRSDERDDRDGNGVIDAIQDTRELMAELERKGWETGTRMTYVEVAGGHNPQTWGSVLPDFLRWAFGGKR